jgi:hypothetical protein
MTGWGFHEIEFAYRAVRAGARIVYDPAAGVFHQNHTPRNDRGRGIDHDRHKALSGARNEEYVQSKDGLTALPPVVSVAIVHGGRSRGPVEHPDRRRRPEQPDPKPVSQAQRSRDHGAWQLRNEQHHLAARARHPGRLPEHRPQPGVQVPLDAVLLPEWQIGHTRRDTLVGQLQAAGVTHPNISARSVPPGSPHGVRVNVKTPRLPASCQQFTKYGARAGARVECHATRFARKKHHGPCNRRP